MEQDSSKECTKDVRVCWRKNAERMSDCVGEKMTEMDVNYDGNGTDGRKTDADYVRQIGRAHV